MIWNYAYTPSIWPSLVTVLLMLALVIFSVRRRNVPGVLPFIIGSLLGAIWAAGSVMEYAALDLSTKIFWIKFQAVWQLPGATAVTCFLLEYAWPGRWLTRRNLILLSVAPILVLGLVCTDDFHHLMWRTFSSYAGSVIPQLGPMGWMAILYSFGLILLNLVVLGWLFLRSPQHRWPVVFLTAGHIGFRTIYVLEKANLIYSDLPLPVLGLAFIDLMYAVALIGFHFFDPIPLARQTAIEQLHDGMLVLDPLGRVASLNPAAERILGVSGKQAKGLPFKSFVSAYPDGPLVETGEHEIEIDHQAGQEIGYSMLSISPLKDWRGIEAGRLVLLRDVTRSKQAEAALNETREFQRLIYEKSFDGISIYEELPDEDKRILVDCNEHYCQMAGRSKEELLAIRDTRVIQRSENLTEESDRAAVLAESAFSGVFSWIRPDGKQNIIEYNAAPIRVGERFFTIGVDRDVTESRQTQAQILEQQRVLATLTEGERLGRELHDSLGQVLGFASLKVGATRKLVADGKLEKADDQMAHLESILSDAHADVREYILNLRTAPCSDQPFLATVRHYLDGFRQNYGIQVTLNVDEGLGQSPFPPEAQVQVFRIMQEALSNARKHGQARCVKISFAAETSLIRITIQDDGQGFDVTQPAGEGHYGLRFIRERAEGLGGRLSVDSAPGKGTRVELEIPFNGERPSAANS